MKHFTKKTDMELAGDIIMLVALFGNVDFAEAPEMPTFTFKDFEGKENTILKVRKKAGSVAVDTFRDGRKHQLFPASHAAYITRDGLVTIVRAVLAFHSHRLDNKT